MKFSLSTIQICYTLSQKKVFKKDLKVYNRVILIYANKKNSIHLLVISNLVFRLSNGKDIVFQTTQTPVVTSVP